MKKLSRTDAQAQGRRLQANPMLAPQSKEGVTEIVDCIMRNCRDVEHAVRTMTAVLDNCTDPRNLTAEIKRAAGEALNVPQALPDGCEVCHLEPDPLTGAARWMAHVPGERKGYSCAVRCTCARGQWLSRRDQERSADHLARKPEAKHEHPADADWARKAAGDSE
jgi:hypothetical protein